MQVNLVQSQSNGVSETVILWHHRRQVNDECYDCLNSLQLPHYRANTFCKKFVFRLPALQSPIVPFNCYGADIVRSEINCLQRTAQRFAFVPVSSQKFRGRQRRKRYVKLVKWQRQANPFGLNESFLACLASEESLGPYLRRHSAQEFHFTGREKSLGDFLTCKLRTYAIDIYSDLAAKGEGVQR